MLGSRRVNSASLGIACLSILIAGLCAAADEPPKESVELDCKPATLDYYPAIAIRNHQEARVLIEYRVNGKGRGTDIHVFAEAADDVFREPAKSFIENLKCKVPPTWEADGGPGRPYLLNIIFQFEPGGILRPLLPEKSVAAISVKRIP